MKKEDKYVFCKLLIFKLLYIGFFLVEDRVDSLREKGCFSTSNEKKIYKI